METIIANMPFFMVVFIRLSAFVTFVPFFNNDIFSIIFKVTLAFVMSVLIFPTIPISSWVIPGNIYSYIIFMMMEILIGIIMGLVFTILLFALQLAGELIGFQMAFSMANVVDATFGMDNNILSVFMVMMGTLLFLVLGGDHYLLYAISKSFHILVPGSVAITDGFLKELSAQVVQAFEIGFKLASPAVILLLSIDLALSFIGKAAAKIQIFFVGLPLKISIGLFGLTFVMTYILSIWGKEIPKLPGYVFRLLHLMKN